MPLGAAGGIAVGARRAELSLGLDVRRALSQTAEVGNDTAGRVHATTSLFMPALCGHRGMGSLCAVAALALINGSGELLARMREVSLVAWGAGARAQVEWPPGGRIAANLYGETLVFGRAVLTVDDMPVMTAGRVVFGLGVAARVQFQ